MKTDIKREYMNLLYNDNYDEMKQYLSSSGKLPKPICPIEFIINNDNEGELNNGTE